MKYRVMYEQETGELGCWRNGLDYADAEVLRDQILEDHIEWRDAWIEAEEGYYA